MKKCYFRCAAALLAVFALLGAPAVAQNVPTPKGKVSASLLRLATTPAASRGAAPQAGAAAIGPFQANTPLRLVDNVQVFDGYVVIRALANTASAKQLLADLQALGLRDGTAYGALVSGLFPVDKLAALESVASLQSARPSFKPITNTGRVTSQGDRSLRADAARAKYGLSGKGVKVGILSDSYNNLNGAAAGVASNELPADVQVLKDLPKYGIDEGRAMAEIVHDVAPKAAIAFHTAVLGEANFAQGIEDLQAAGCQVIVDDIQYFDEPFFQNGIVAQAAQAVVGRGAAYFSAAGNAGNQSYDSKFRNSGRLQPGITGKAHDFGNGDIRQSIVLGPGQVLLLALQWDDPAFSASGVRGAKTDLDLHVLYDGLPLYSSVDNNIGGDPFEFVGLYNDDDTESATVEVVIVKFAGPDPARIKYVNFGSQPVSVEYDTKSATLTGHANAPQAVAVAAASYLNTPTFNAATPVPLVEDFSSLGGTPLLFDNAGKRLAKPVTPGKPEVTGPDGGNTSFFYPDYDPDKDGLPNFFGTSAAAPHVAAVAALMLEAGRNDLAPATLTKYLQQTAVDMDDPFTPGFDVGFDFRTGAGFAQADAAVARVVRAQRAKNGASLLVSQYPNPSSGRVAFKVAAQDQQPIQLTVFDQMGKVVFRAEGAEQLDITQDFSGLPKGLYVIKVQTGTDVKTQQLLIQ